MNDLILTKEIITQIFYIRGRKVMLDFHLAGMYEVETRALKQQVNRNIERFPEDFMFRLTEKEWKELITICDNLGAFKFSPIAPYAFTEQGVAMLSGILRSKKAIAVNIAIMRAFVKMRELIDENKDLKKKLDLLEAKYDKQFHIVFEAMKQLIQKENEPREPVGFKIKKKE
ncbi:MAG TPA: ORF6N domain-containing protein [Bacteroidales bacterium]|nr:ORF6N domain-containing protein [Bacteroidales bacterium]